MSASTPITIYFHADCLDGFGAAYAAWRRFGDAARYRPMHHGQLWQPDDVDGRQVYILDFSFSPATLEQMAAHARSVIQIDHHASALKDWEERTTKEEDGSQTFRHSVLPLAISFNLQKSGARMAWEYFHPKDPVPLALLHIEDLDLWRFALPQTRPYCRTLRLQPFEFEAWHELIEQTVDGTGARYQEMLGTGRAIEQFLDIEVTRLSQGRLSMPARLRGEPIDALQAMRHGVPVIGDGDRAWRAINGLAINANALFASELGHRLAEQSGSFALVWMLAADGEVKASLRSQGDFDVAEIARRYGGGGHRNAAGFRLPVADFMAEVLGLGQ